MSCQYDDLGLKELEAAEKAAVAAGHMTAEQAAAVTKSVSLVRIEAKEIIVRLEPRHISGWASLIEILGAALQRARVQQSVNGEARFF